VSVVYFLLMVGVLVTVHELGHFLAAKALGIKVLRFSLGFGPAIARVRGRETEYQIGVVPLGGYVRMLGEDPHETVPEADRDRSFSEKPLWRRLIVVFAGPIANLICPLAIYFFFFAGHSELPAAVIGDVFTGGPAAVAGIEPGDRVLEINGTMTRYWEEVEEIVDANPGKLLRFKLRRGNQDLYTYVTPQVHTVRGRNGEKSEQGLIGITQAPFEPEIGVLDASSPAARAGLRTGDLIISVNGHPIDSYTELDAALAAHRPRAPVAYLRARHAGLGFADVKLYQPAFADLVPAPPSGPPIVSPGANGRLRRPETGVVSAEFFVASVEPGSPADRAGIKVGDLITSHDGAPVTHWMVFDQSLQADADRVWKVGWLRSAPGGGTQAFTADIKQEHRQVTDEYGQSHDQLVFGAVNDFHLGTGEMAPIDGRFLYAAGHAFDRTVSTIGLMARGLASLVRGQLPGDTFGGPIMMYRMASVSGAKGWDAFLMMLALISINLGLINLLPIPILDGGHLLMFAVEAVRRRRLSPRVREAVVMAGLVIIVSLTVLALRNDIVRYLIH
jgi:regulator of sigma E protease